MSRLFGATVGAALIVSASLASAEPSRWAQAREPKLAAATRALREAEEVSVKLHRFRELNTLDPAGALVDARYLAEMREALAAGLREAPEHPRLLLELALVKQRLSHLTVVQATSAPILVKEAATLFQKVVDSDLATPPQKLFALTELAIQLARLEQFRPEIRAYDAALELEPDARARSVLLANQAEAFMVLADVDKALAGYQHAVRIAPHGDDRLSTTYWGLAVATDRMGDLDKALSLIALARSYDEFDKHLFGDDDGTRNWFFVPGYDEHYYRALGCWQHARDDGLLSTRMSNFLIGLRSWRTFIVEARPDDPYVPIARARLEAMQKEHDAFVAKHQLPSTKP